VDPAVVPAGNTTTAAGAGFVPGRTVRLEWRSLDGRLIGDACSATVGPGGTFLETCLVLPNSPLGARRMRAVEAVPPGDPMAGRTAAADLLIVPGTMERGRGRFLQRR
jgi:hypothetical protein